MSPREKAAWSLTRVCIFAGLVVGYWEPLPGIAWLILLIVFAGGLNIKLS